MVRCLANLRAELDELSRKISQALVDEEALLVKLSPNPISTFAQCNPNQNQILQPSADSNEGKLPGEDGKERREKIRQNIRIQEKTIRGILQGSAKKNTNRGTNQTDGDESSNSI